MSIQPRHVIASPKPQLKAPQQSNRLHCLLPLPCLAVPLWLPRCCTGTNGSSHLDTRTRGKKKRSIIFVSTHRKGEITAKAQSSIFRSSSDPGIPKLPTVVTCPLFWRLPGDSIRLALGQLSCVARLLVLLLLLLLLLPLLLLPPPSSKHPTNIEPRRRLSYDLELRLPSPYRTIAIIFF